MDRGFIADLANILESPVENPNSEWPRLRCPVAFYRHASGTDRHPAWAVHHDPHGRSYTRCWACDTRGTAEDVLADALALARSHDARRVPVLERALAFVQEHDAGGLAGAFAKLRLARREREQSVRLRGGGFDVAGYVARCARTTSQYVIDRGLVASDIQRWRIGYDEGPTRIGRSIIHHRVVFPIWDEHKRLIGATMRTVLPPGVDDPKYRDTPDLTKGEIFYGEHDIDTTRGTVHIVEGILDAVIASRYLPNVVALLGANTGMGPERIAKLRRWADRVVLILDGDEAGREAVEGKWVEKDGRRRWKPGLREILRPYFVVMVAYLPQGTDPADVQHEVVRYVNDAVYL